MLQITKIFRFEMAHAIDGYAGKCKNVHGHSYALHVTVGSNSNEDDYLSAPGFVIDFKQLKNIVNERVVDILDHKLVLSTAYLKLHESLKGQENLVIWEYEPSAENMLIYIKKNLQSVFPKEIKLVKLRLFETADSYAEWRA